MHSAISLSLLCAAVSVQATLYNAMPGPAAMVKRQGGDSFIPSSVSVGSTCPAGEEPCGTEWCTITARGDSCCKEGYACPGGSFCLTQGYCCPDGDDPESCAKANGVTLPSDFNTSPAPASSTAAPTSESTSAAPVATTPASSPAPYPITSTSSAPTYVASGTGAGNYSTPPISQFTGAAAPNTRAEIGGGLALVLGALGYFL